MKKLILILASLLCFSGCTAIVNKDPLPDLNGNTKSNAPSYASPGSDFVQKNYKATDDLIASLKYQLDNRTPLIVATIVNIDELTESSRLGRTISEQIASRLTNLGFQVVEIKMRGNIFVKRDEGELLLSREVSQIMKSHNAQAVVIGTYSVAKNYVYINLKLISKFNNVIIAVTSPQ